VCRDLKCRIRIGKRSYSPDKRSRKGLKRDSTNERHKNLVGRGRPMETEVRPQVLIPSLGSVLTVLVSSVIFSLTSAVKPATARTCFTSLLKIKTLLLQNVGNLLPEYSVS
jgi:hypothetical protein